MSLLLFLISIFLYTFCMSSGSYGGDSGDLLSAVYVNGVAHPSGYPLYLIIGRIITGILPDIKNFAWQLGTVSALFSSLSVAFYYQIILRLTKNKIVSLISALTLLVSYPFWLYSITVEVFSLHIFLITCIVYLLIRVGETKEEKYLYLLATVLGVSLTNNQTIILIFPPVGISLLIIYGLKLFNFKRAVICFLLFVLGLIPYLYLTYLASKLPSVNWGFALNFDNFIALITRKEYGWNSFEKGLNVSGIINSLIGTLNYWIIYIGLGVIFPFVIGFFNIPKSIKGWFLPFLLISCFLFGPFFFVYANTPPKNFLTFAVFEKFYLSGFYISMYVFPFGIILMHKFTSDFVTKHRLPLFIASIIPIVFFISTIGMFVRNFPKLNFRHIEIGDNFAKDILDSLPQGSTLLLMSDTHAFNAIYLQKVLNYRTDIAIPGLYDGFDKILRVGINDKQELDKTKIEMRGSVDNTQMGLAISHLAANENLFSDQKLEIVDNKYGKIISIPWGLLYKVEVQKESNYTKEEYVQKMNEVFSNFRLNQIVTENEVLSQSLTFADAKKIYSIAHERVAYYLKENYNDEENALFYLKKSIELDPFN